VKVRVYDLESLYDRLNRLYFDSKLELIVRWSRVSPSKAKRSILLGSFQQKTKTITLSRRLDNLDVPLYFVEHVIFHEMLHAVFPRDNHRMHTEKFKRFEKLHPDFERAREWEKKNIGLLMQAAFKQRSLFLNPNGKTAEN